MVYFRLDVSGADSLRPAYYCRAYVLGIQMNTNIGEDVGTWAKINLPHDLHEETKWLVVQFAEAMAQKLAAAERKYGYNDGWRSPDWMDECRAKLLEHLAKGDPRDVANYCAFLWYHHQPTVKISSTFRTDQWAECFSKRVCVIRDREEHMKDK